MTDNRRTSTRHVVSLAASLTVDGSTQPSTIVNLSLGGALLIGSAKLAMGQRVSLAFSVPTIEEQIEVGATVRWSDDSATGIQFDGLRAREVWGLNQFLKRVQPSVA